MRKLLSVDKQTDNKFLNMFVANYEEDGEESKYFIASRKKNAEDLDCMTGKMVADAVIIVPVYTNGDILFIKQFRKPINDYIYEFPAGLIDAGETSKQAAIRELHEETGLSVVSARELIKPTYTSVGMSDEAVGIYIAEVQGELSQEYQEKSEDINFEIVKIDDLAKFIKENKVAMQASILSLFLYSIEKGEY
jgi:ADP-ribose pyrophosphatase